MTQRVKERHDRLGRSHGKLLLVEAEEKRVV
jgi:hypothetical protein